jgi:hypothetical protein
LCGWRSVATSYYHACAVDSGGQVHCWGAYFASASPAGVHEKVFAGPVNTCAIDASGAVTCWGEDDYGVQNTPSGVFVDLAISGSFACGIMSSGQIRCWGSDDYAGSTPTGVTSPPSGTFTDIDVHYNGACGLTSGKRVICWGGLASSNGGQYFSAGVDFCVYEELASATGGGPWGFDSAGGFVGANVLCSGATYSPSCSVSRTTSSAYAWLFGLDSSDNASCGIRPSGALACSFGAPAGDFRAVDAASWSSTGGTVVPGYATYGCAISTDGHLVCFGVSPYGSSATAGP